MSPPPPPTSGEQFLLRLPPISSSAKSKIFAQRADQIFCYSLIRTAQVLFSPLLRYNLKFCSVTTVVSQQHWFPKISWEASVPRLYMNTSEPFFALSSKTPAYVVMYQRNSGRGCAMTDANSLPDWLMHSQSTSWESCHSDLQINSFSRLWEKRTVPAVFTHCNGNWCCVVFANHHPSYCGYYSSCWLSKRIWIFGLFLTMDGIMMRLSLHNKLECKNRRVLRKTVYLSLFFSQ